MATTKRQRSCIACGKLAGKAELMRIVRDPSGVVSFDKTGRAPGRGAYVCSAECFAAACKKKKLDRALKATLGKRRVRQDRRRRRNARARSEIEVEEWYMAKHAST